MHEIRNIFIKKKITTQDLYAARTVQPGMQINGLGYRSSRSVLYEIASISTASAGVASARKKDEKTVNNTRRIGNERVTLGSDTLLRSLFRWQIWHYREYNQFPDIIPARKLERGRPTGSDSG